MGMSINSKCQSMENGQSMGNVNLWKISIYENVNLRKTFNFKQRYLIQYLGLKIYNMI